ncbi:MAG: hypothetical protein V1754_02835, partial [Pseudomonadota bacterium]
PGNVRDSEAILSAIANAANCSSAAGIAEACAWGSSIDVSFAGEAEEICQKGLDKLTPDENENTKLREIYTYLEHRCFDLYADQKGTMYRSMLAFCRLGISEFFNSLSASVE